MNNLYKKFNVSIDSSLIDSLLGTETFEKFTFHEYDVKNQELLHQIIDAKIKFNIKPDYVNITKITSPGVPGHTDAWPVALNFYLQGASNSNVTEFWESKTTKHVSGPLALVYEGKPDDLSLIGSIRILAGDCYLLNTHVLHSVNVEDEDRYILRFCWYNETFESIKDSIEIKQ